WRTRLSGQLLALPDQVHEQAHAQGEQDDPPSSDSWPRASSDSYLGVGMIPARAASGAPKMPKIGLLAGCLARHVTDVGAVIVSPCQRGPRPTTTMSVPPTVRLSTTCQPAATMSASAAVHRRLVRIMASVDDSGSRRSSSPGPRSTMRRNM